jgi:hypothetical protein
VANEKYDNLTVLMSTGKLNWVGDVVTAYLMTGVTFNAAHVTLVDAGGTRMGMMPIQQRSVASTGSLLGSAVSFDHMPKDTDFQVLIAKESGGPGTVPQLLAFFDSDGDDQPLRIKNNGTLIVRPEAVQPVEDTGQGAWIQI